MIEVILAVAVFVLAIAVIGLFAMMGELASRVPQGDPTAAESTALEPIGDARLGGEVDDWPAEISHIQDADHGVLVVFSTICTPCRLVAGGRTGPLAIPSPAAGIVVSCPRPNAGTAFVQEHPMVREYPVALDLGGDWLTRSFDLDVSPSVLVFERGRLRSAFTFTAAAALQQVPVVHDHEKEDVGESERTAA